MPIAYTDSEIVTHDPAMVLPIRDADGKLNGIHVTWLNSNLMDKRGEVEALFDQDADVDKSVLFGALTRMQQHVHVIVLGEAHLRRRILRSYARYYNDIRTHRSLDKDAPISRLVQRTGRIISRPILGGLHHHYIRA